MKSWRRFGGAIALLLAAAGIVGCVAGVIGVWMFCQQVGERVRTISAGLDGGLQRASAANQNVQRAVEKACTDLAKVRKESAELSNGRDKRSRASRALRTLIQQQVGPNIEDLGGRLATLADTASAVSSVLQSFQELPARRTRRIQQDQLERWADEVQQLSATLRRLEGAVGDGDKESNGREVVAATSEVDLALQRWQAKVEDWQSDVDATRDNVRDVAAEVLGWLTPAALVVTLVLVWMAVGQISLFAHALKWRRGA
jgi:hypothetical protein